MIQKVNRLLSTIFKWRVLLIYRIRWAKRRRMEPGLFQLREATKEKAHQQFWQGLGYAVKLDCYRYYAGLSGVDNAAYIPEDLFYTVVERCLNDMNYAPMYGDKMLYDKLYKKVVFPRTVLRLVNGRFLSDSYEVLTSEEAKAALQTTKGDLVLKKTNDSCGGKSIRMLKQQDDYFVDGNQVFELEGFASSHRTGFILQERIVQCEFTGQFNTSSLNTFRVMTLRLPGNEQKVVVLKSILRMGVGKVNVDNEASGGISVGVFADGRFNDYAVSGNGEKFYAHPASGVEFKGQCCPYIKTIYEMASKLAELIPHLRLVSFDLAVDRDHNVRCIEVNTSSVSISFLQVYGESLFGKFSKQVVDFCRANRGDDQFKYLRTFY